MKQLKRIVLVALAAALTAGMLGCSDRQSGNSVKETEEYSEAVSDNSVEATIDNEAKESTESAYIKTPYITFEIPDLWNSIFTVEEYDEEGYILTFKGREELSEITVFSLYFGGEDHEAHHLGSLGDVEVYVKVNEDYEGLSDVQADKLEDLQEYVNELLVQIQEHENFTR